MSEEFEMNIAEEDTFMPAIDTQQDDAPQTEDKDSLTVLSREGYLLLKVNEIEKAEAEFKKMLALDENNNYALVGLGDAARKRNSFKEAAEYYSECLKHHPGNNYALFGLADCYKTMNLYGKAIEIWEQYLEHDSSNITVLTRVADAYRKIHDFQNSKRLYTKVLEAEAGNPYALIGLGHLHYDFKKYREALFYWQKIFEQNNENVDIRILTSIGNCYRKMKQFDKGVPFFEKALEKSPNNFYGLFGLADCYRGMNQQEHSIQYWDAILKQDPSNKVILTRVGDAYRHIGEYDKAQETYEKALDIDYEPYAILGLAILCKIKGQYQEAVNSLSGLLQTDRKNYRIYLELADCYIKLREKAKAIEILRAFQLYGIKNQQISDLLASLQK